MAKYRVMMKKGTGYYDELANININSPSGYAEITEDDILNKNLKNLVFSCKVGSIKIIDENNKDVDIKKVKEKLEKENEEEDGELEEKKEPENPEDNEEENNEKEVGEEKTSYEICQATTASGKQCSNPASYPKENPKYCHLSSHQKEE